uniref:Uncharacterized protein n=1 Tax=Rhipicephalus zambeziensis TaxID=60191 RepID=A0A224YFM0_9ACAR
MYHRTCLFESNNCVFYRKQSKKITCPSQTSTKQKLQSWLWQQPNIRGAVRTTSPSQNNIRAHFVASSCRFMYSETSVIRISADHQKYSYHPKFVSPESRKLACDKRKLAYIFINRFSGPQQRQKEL